MFHSWFRTQNLFCAAAITNKCLYVAVLKPNVALRLAISDTSWTLWKQTNEDGMCFIIGFRVPNTVDTFLFAAPNARGMQITLHKGSNPDKSFVDKEKDERIFCLKSASLTTNNGYIMQHKVSSKVILKRSTRTTTYLTLKDPSHIMNAMLWVFKY